MTVAAILELIAFALTETPVVIADIQSLVSTAQAINAGQTPSQEQAALAQAIAARKKAVATALGS